MGEAEETSDTAPGEATPTFSPGDRFNRYEVVKYIGSGAMSEVYEAIHLDLEKSVALKLLRAERVGNQTARARFLREGRAAARLRHPGVVEIFDVGEERGRPYLVMELLQGHSLEEHLSEQGRLEVEQAVQLVLPIAAAVQTAHDVGVLHRDLKPENIFLTHDGPRRIRPKIVDFGVSSFLDVSDNSRLTMETDILGTPQYMAPEQARGESLDTRADQYSVGVMLFEALSGRLPHERSSLVDLLHAVAYEPGQKLGSVAPELPADLVAVVDKALSHRAEDRFGSVKTFALALAEFASPAAKEFWVDELTNQDSTVSPSRVQKSPFVITLTSSPPLAPLSASSRGQNRGALYIGGAVLIALLIGFGSWWFTRGGAGTPQVVGASPQTAEVESALRVNLRTVPDTARILLDDEPVGVGEYDGELPLRDLPYSLVVRAVGYQPRSFEFTTDPPPRVVVLSPEAPREGAAERQPPVTVEELPETAPTPTVRRAAKRRALARRRAAAPTTEAEPASADVSEPPPSPTVTPPRAPTAPPPRNPATPSIDHRLTDNIDPWR